MYVPIGRILTVKGWVYLDTLCDEEQQRKYPTKQNYPSKIGGYVNFIKDGNGVCDILQICETY